MNIYAWARRWNIPASALRELETSLGMVSDNNTMIDNADPKLEGFAQAAVRLEAARKGVYLWRNNVGAGKLENGLFMRWGLANDSKQLNEVMKSSDLIGIRKVLITGQHIGQHIGQFICREIKRPGWTFSHTKAEEAQLRFINLINTNGGDAQFATGEGTL